LCPWLDPKCADPKEREWYAPYSSCDSDSSGSSSSCRTRGSRTNREKKGRNVKTERKERLHRNQSPRSSSKESATHVSALNVDTCDAPTVAEPKDPSGLKIRKTKNEKREHRKEDRQSEDTTHFDREWRRPRSSVHRVFDRYDRNQDGKLCFFDLRQALAGLHLSDLEIRAWILERDRGKKGYVTLADFHAWFDTVRRPRQGPPQPQIQARQDSSLAVSGSFHSTTEKTERVLETYYAAPAQAWQGGTYRLGGLSLEQRQKVQRLFAAMDQDQDGRIRAVDVQSYFQDHGKSQQQDMITWDAIVEWIQEKDTKGQGAVDMEDFLRYYEHHHQYQQQKPPQVMTHTKHG
jgi:Ca2+-binding EF-hand superfamily protein